MNYVNLFTNSQPNPSLFGGKGSNLIKLIKFGFNVPSGFIINTNAYVKFLESSQIKHQIHQTLSEDYNPKEVIHFSQKIKNLFLKSPIPQEIVDEISRHYQNLCEESGRNSSFSVRSSANIEDSKNFSFAGQAESFLNNKTLEEILSSIKNCWISLFSPQALLYLLQIKKTDVNLSINKLKMAVVIQKMINSDTSGVLFTANVINNDLNQMLINSSWGLGETIANNLIIPDLIILNKQNFQILKRIIGKKGKRSIPNPEGSSTILVENELEISNKCSVNESQLRHLYILGLQIESKFSYPQDIEWAIEHEIIYILQSRPITTLIEK